MNSEAPDEMNCWNFNGGIFLHIDQIEKAFALPWL
jgi:hypothetical protein